MRVVETFFSVSVDDMARATRFYVEALGAAVERAGGRVVAAEVEVAPGVVVADVVDTEANTFTLTRAST